jgi:hypothetical protein
MGAGLWPTRAALGARGRLCAGLYYWRWLGCVAGGMVVVMMGLFLVLCLGAAVTILVAWLFVQILLWIQE